MRYIRFLKPPRVVAVKGSQKKNVSCLITITSDLGETFFPHHVGLVVGLLAAEEGDEDEDEDGDERSESKREDRESEHEPTNSKDAAPTNTKDNSSEQEDIEDVDTTQPPLPTKEQGFKKEEKLLSSHTVKWTPHLRSLPITLPLQPQHSTTPLRLRISTSPSSSLGNDTLPSLSADGAHGIVSAWSAVFSADKAADRHVQRRLGIGGREIRVWEETGESIERHVWDAGVTFSCNLSSFLLTQGLDTRDELFVALSVLRTHLSSLIPKSTSNPSNPPLRILELGTGCGILGLTLATLLPQVSVTLSDLPSATEIATRNMSIARCAPGSGVRWVELDWDEALPGSVRMDGKRGMKRKRKREGEGDVDGEEKEKKDKDKDKEKQKEGWDLVVAADVTYNADSSPSLVRTLTSLALLSHKLCVAIAMKMRHSSEEVFFSLMRDAGFEQTACVTWDVPGDVRVGEERVDLHVYRYIGQEE